MLVFFKSNKNFMCFLSAPIKTGGDLRFKLCVLKTGFGFPGPNGENCFKIL